MHSGQVTVTVTSAPDGTGAADIPSSTLSLIYIYSTSTSAQPTRAASSSSGNNSTHVSGGVIAGIVIGCIAFLVLMSLILFCYSRKVARKRRAEMASLRHSRPIAPSRAYSHATTLPGTVDDHHPNRGSQYARSVGAISAGTGTRTMSRSLKSPSLMPARPPPVELPISPHSKGARTVNTRKSRPEVAEMYGSYTHPIELQAGSPTNVVSSNSELKRLTACGGEEKGRYRDRPDSDVGSRGYMSPEPDWQSSKRPDSVGAETEYGTADGASIHIYYRSSAATIAQAMSQASLTKVSSNTMRSSSTPFFSQTSLADTAR